MQKIKNSNTKTRHFTSRIAEEVILIMDKVLTLSGMDKRSFVEFAIIEKCLTFDNVDNVVNGINFNDYCSALKFERERYIHGLMRKEFMSKVTFMNRFQIDLYKLFIVNANINEINEYIELRCKESECYKNNEKLVTHMNTFKNIDEFKYKHIKNELRSRIDAFDINYMSNNPEKYMKNMLLEYKKTIGEEFKKIDEQALKNGTGRKTKKI